MDDYWIFNSIFYANIYDKLKLNNDDIMLDIGANIGLATVLYHKKVKCVIAIEPESKNFEILRKNLQVNNCRNVIAINKAVSDKNERVIFDITGGSAIAKKSDDGIEADKIDNILKELNERKPITFINKSQGNAEYKFKYNLTDRQVKIIKEGGLLNETKALQN